MAFARLVSSAWDKVSRGAQWLLAREWFPLVVLVGLYVSLRLAFLTADPPTEMIHGFQTRELLVEPVAKASEARNWALFGTFTPNPADGYQFWRPQSPVWVYSLAGFFRVFGTGYRSLRLYSTLLCTLGYLALLVLAKKRLGVRPMIILGLLLAVDHVGILYERSGLLEPVVTAILMGSFYFLDRARDRVEWIIPAAVLALLAFFVKQAAFVAVPALLVFGIKALVEAKGPTRKWVARGLVISASLGLAAVLVYVVSRPAYQRGLAWNYGNVMLGKHQVEHIDLDDWEGSGYVPTKAVLLHRLGLLGIVAPLTGVLALVEIGRIVVSLVRKQPVDRARILFALYFVSSFAFLVAVKPTTVRYLLVLSPSAAYLTASLLGSLVEKGRAWVPRIACAVLLFAFVGFHGYAYRLFFSKRTYHVIEAGRAVRMHIGPRKDAVLIGLWSAPIAMETPYQHYYVKGGFNQTKADLDALRPTHLLLLSGADFTRAIVLKQKPKLLQRAQRGQAFVIHGFPVTLFDVNPLDIPPLPPAH